MSISVTSQMDEDGRDDEGITTIGTSTSTVVECNCRNQLDEVLQLYRNDPFILDKIDQFMTDKFAAMFERIKCQKQRALTQQQELDQFCSNFVYNYIHQNNSGRYFYIPSAKRYVEYVSTVTIPIYRERSVDDLTFVTGNYIDRMCAVDGLSNARRSALVAAVFSEIRTTPISTTIPETTTIQHIMDLLVPSAFPTKSDAKFFLTAVGDHLLGKTNRADEVFYYPTAAKQAISWLSDCITKWFGPSGLLTSFRCKPSPTVVSKRALLIRMNRGTNLFSEIHHSFNLLTMCCVACHYSDRHRNAYTYLTKYCTDDRTINYSLTMEPNINGVGVGGAGPSMEVSGPPEAGIGSSAERLFARFKNEFFDIGHLASSPSISRKSVMFLWRQFLDLYQIPGFVYADEIQLLLKKQPFYDAVADTFAVNSVQYSFTEQFIRFWNETMKEPELVHPPGASSSLYRVSAITVCPIHTLELGEIAILFRNWVARQPICTTLKQGSGTGTVFWDDARILDTIRYFFPEVIITEDNGNGTKHSVHIQSTEWAKFDEVAAFIQSCLAEERGSSFITTSPSTSSLSLLVDAKHPPVVTSLSLVDAKHPPVVTSLSLPDDVIQSSSPSVPRSVYTAYRAYVDTVTIAASKTYFNAVWIEPIGRTKTEGIN
jgi:hypothetical protein